MEITQVLGKAPVLWVRYIFTITLPLGHEEQFKPRSTSDLEGLKRAEPKQKIFQSKKRAENPPPTDNEHAYTLFRPLMNELGFDHIFVMVGDAYVIDGMPIVDFFGSMFDLTWVWQAINGHFMQTNIGWSEWESGRSQKPVYTGKTTTKSDEEIWKLGQWNLRSCPQRPDLLMAI